MWNQTKLPVHAWGYQRRQASRVFRYYTQNTNMQCAFVGFSLSYKMTKRIELMLHEAFLVNTPLVQRASYSSDLQPCYFWLYPNLKTTRFYMELLLRFRLGDKFRRHSPHSQIHCQMECADPVLITTSACGCTS